MQPELTPAPPKPPPCCGDASGSTVAAPLRGDEEMLIGQSAAIAELRALVRCCAQSRAAVLIEGETGVGKELVARSLHRAGACAGEPFVAVDCGTLPEQLAESELFGHRRGAFTGAESEHIGLVAAAARGTLFLDEVEDLSLGVQAKLLRFLQESEYRPVGAVRPRRSEARIVAASNSDLARLVDERRFRRDLFFRLEVLRLGVPPLRERLEDLPLLIRHLVKQCLRREAANGRSRAKQDVEAELERAMPSERQLDALAQHRWSGNVRELSNLVARTTVFAAAVDWRIAWESGISCLAKAETSERAPRASAEARLVLSPSPSQADPASRDPAAEYAMLSRLLARHRWRRAAAAKELGVSRVTLWRRMKRAGLTVDSAADAA